MPLYGLKALLRYRGIPYRELAEILDITITTFSNKINEKNGSQFNRGEIAKMAAYLNMTQEERDRFFFAEVDT